MTYPADDDYVSLEDDYAVYDQDWLEEVQPDSPYRPNKYDITLHELWPVAESRGWVEMGGKGQGNGGLFREGGPNQSMADAYNRREWVYFYTRSSQAAASSMGISNPQRHGWLHLVTNPDADGSLSKDYLTFGELLDAADQRARGGGYDDYHRNPQSQ